MAKVSAARMAQNTHRTELILNKKYFGKASGIKSEEIHSLRRCLNSQPVASELFCPTH